MASITMRNQPDATKDTLRVWAAERGIISLEAYVRNLLQEESARASTGPLLYFAPAGVNSLHIGAGDAPGCAVGPVAVAPFSSHSPCPCTTWNAVSGARVWKYRREGIPPF